MAETRKIGDILRLEVWPKLSKKRDEWQEDFRQFEAEQAKLFDELCKEKGILKV